MYSIDTKCMEEPIIRKVWTSNNISNTLITSIPNEFAEKHGIKLHTNLIVVDTSEGILYKKLEVKV